MKIKTSVSFMVALVLALITAKVGYDYMKKYGHGGGPAGRVVVAKADMDPGYVIQAGDVSLQEVPLSMVTARTLRDLKEVVGRTVISTIATNYPITESVLAP